MGNNFAPILTEQLTLSLANSIGVVEGLFTQSYELHAYLPRQSLTSISLTKFAFFPAYFALLLAMLPIFLSCSPILLPLSPILLSSSTL